jgi:NAD(P)-dependent dehydrogenase (short-subunit alcohol dehydrogenase family)
MEGKVGLVTGAGSGIGRASARAFAAEGAKVVVSDVNAEAGAETVRLIAEAGGEATFVRCDVTVEAEVEALVAATVARYGQLDWAHNNAGGGGTPTVPVVEQRAEHIEQTLRVNLVGLFFCLKHEIPAMMASGGGAIVNTSSAAGLRAALGLGPYGAAKWGVNGLTRTAALEYARKGIRVNSICPGMTATPSVANWTKEVPERAAEVLDRIPMGRMGTPEDQANAAVWLCSDRAAYITGVNLAVDGGQLIAQ